MSYLRDFAHSFQNIGHVRPEQKAIPTLMIKPMIRELAKREGSERIRAGQLSNRQYRNRMSLANYKADVRAARQDAPIATAIQAGTLVGEYAASKKQDEITAQYAKWNEEYIDRINDLNEVIRKNAEKYMQILTGNTGTTKPLPMSGRLEEPRGVY